MKSQYTKIISKLGKDTVAVGTPLSQHTYMKVGGPADVFFIARTVEDLVKAIRVAIETKTPYFILGGGSNIIVGDKGIRGLVIKNRADKITIRKFRGRVRGNKMKVSEAKVVADSGVITNLLVRRTIDEGLMGLEYFLGVPGTIGGAIYNNSHFQTELIGNVVESVNVIDPQGKTRSLSKQDLRFAYDYSVLQETNDTLLQVTFLLSGGDTKTLWKKAEEFAKYRSQSQPLNFPSSGCMFKNVDAKKGTYGQERRGLTSAGYLIDKAGLKGTRVGGAMISEKHASFIVNTGEATASDILKLAEIIREKVRKKFHVELKLEVFPVGEF